MSTYLALAGALSADVQDCPRPRIVAALRWAVAEFCRQSGAWTQDVTFTIPAGQTEYEPGDEVDAGLIRSVRSVTSVPSGVEFSIGPEAEFRLLAAQDQDVTVHLQAVLGPDADESELPECVARDYQYAIEHGALSRLRLEMQPWGNGALAQYHAREFRKAIGRARAEAAVQRVDDVMDVGTGGLGE